MQAKTCGPMYFDALSKYAGDDDALIRVFAAGFINGQAEKVYLGACRAAMFRPSEERYVMVRELAKEACERYNLNLFYAPDGEVWICRSVATWKALDDLYAQYDNRGAEWHRRRGELCGVPAHEIDEEFHKRKGHGEPCDTFRRTP